MVRGTFLSSSSVEKYLKTISEKAKKVDEIACLIDADCKQIFPGATAWLIGRTVMRKMATFMYGGFRGLNDRFNRLETRLFRPAGGRERMLDWLKAVFTDDEWETALHSRTPGTCGWILQRRQFRSWLSSTNGTDQMKILWIHGPPGFGKTVLCASIVEHLQNENPARVAHFFCVSDNEAKRQPFAIVRSWVAQMV